MLAPEVQGEKAQFEFMATSEYLPWFIHISHPIIENPTYEDDVAVACTIVNNEVFERNRRALDLALKWIDLPDEECTIESTKKIVSDVVNFLSMRILTTTTTTTTTSTTTATTTSASDGPLKESKHDNAAT
ncbi:hypothetical protein Scep_004227 [Stephania cephalantha]|uniref:Uncharacterized protein n=1 Tax=Stephania cephalantha TaxID=152367 RepID=A0AAP0KTI9_9MAGN